jgi:AraC-like DNA-binding protein
MSCIRKAPGASRSRLVQPTTAPVYLRSLLDEAGRQGIDPAHWFEGLGFEAADLDIPGCMVPHRDALTVLRRALALMADPELGLTLGRQDRITHRGGLALGMMGSRTLGAAMALTRRFPRSAGYLLEVRDERSASEHSLVAATAPSEHDVQAYLVDVLFAGHLHLRRVITGARCSPLRVELVRQRPVDITAHERFFECPVTFGGLQNRMVSEIALLDLPLPWVSEVALRQAIWLLERDADRASEQSPLLSSVERTILELLPAVACQSEVAFSLNLSERSLRRKLEAEGVGFRGMLDACRKSRALELMSSGRHSSAEVAGQTGFSDVKTFQRAHRRWRVTQAMKPVKDDDDRDWPHS